MSLPVLVPPPKKSVITLAATPQTLSVLVTPQRPLYDPTPPLPPVLFPATRPSTDGSVSSVLASRGFFDSRLVTFRLRRMRVLRVLLQLSLQRLVLGDQRL